MSISISTGHRSSYPLIFHSIDSLTSVINSALGGPSDLTIVITDTNVASIYGKRITTIMSASGKHVLLTVPPGESSKSQDVLSGLYDQILGLEMDRRTPVVAVGGGVVGDLAGYAAATTLRGLPLVHVPTSLTAQVDSSIGGKTGINHSRGKNLIGSFYPPKAVLCDTTLLDTLPFEEWISGLAEVVKHALIDGGDHYNSLVARWDEIVNRSTSSLRELVRQSAMVKARIVEHDEREAGTRMWLNLGHTTGHSIERISGYGEFSHGEAVAAGIAVAIELSKVQSPNLDDKLAYNLLASMNISRKILALNPADVFKATSTDKKRRGSNVPFVVLDDIGAPGIDFNVSVDDFLRAWKAMTARLAE